MSLEGTRVVSASSPEALAEDLETARTDGYEPVPGLLTCNPATGVYVQVCILGTLGSGSLGNLGEAADGMSVVERGDAGTHQTVIEIDTVLPAIAGGASLGVGVLAYTLPAGAIIVDSSSLSVAITQTEDNITADTPEVGVGTTQAAGVVAVLSGTAGFENIVTGQVADDCDGAVTTKTTIPTAGVPLVIEAADDHTIFVNVADGWAADGDAAAILQGSLVLNWRFMG